MEKIANLHGIPPLSTYNATRRPVYSADAMLCVDWLVSLSIVFHGFDWLRQTVLFFLNWTACVF